MLSHYTEKMSYFGQTMTSEADASGSGIIVGQNDTELLIVSNYHVIADSDELTVQFVEGSEARASIKGTDPDMDLAVIAVPIGDVNSSTLQDSTALPPILLELMPTTSPFMFKSAPPELPGLIAASVCIKVPSVPSES